MIKMTFDKWKKEYKPITNPFGCGYLFETHGEELDFVIARYESNYETVWTLCQADDEKYIQAGMWVVNRDGYYITEKPCDIDEVIVLTG